MGAWDDVVSRCEPARGWAVDCYLCGPRPLPTGTPLDNALGGGLMPGLTLLGGRASSGKSAIACQAAASVADRGGRVLYLTLDDSWGNVTARCMSAWSYEHSGEFSCGPFMWSGLDETRRLLDRWRTGDPTRDAFELRRRDAALMAAAHWEDGPARRLAIVDDTGDVGEVEGMVASLADEGCAPDLVVVDYVQQYSTGDQETDRNEISRVDRVASRLQRMALWGGIPVLAVSALRKMEREGEEPSLDWFRGTSQLGYAAWAACIVTRGDEIDRVSRKGAIHTVKNKGGLANFSTDIRLMGAYSRAETM